MAKPTTENQSSRIYEKAFGKTLPEDHEDRIAGKGFNSLSHKNLAHKFIPTLQATKNPGCESRCGQRVGEARTVASMAIEQCKKQKKKVIQEAQKERRTVHFATLMDICHLKNSELEPNIQCVRVWQ